MLYDAYEMQRSMLAGASAMATFGADWMRNPANPWSYVGGGQLVSSALEASTTPSSMATRWRCMRRSCCKSRSAS